MSKKRDYRPLSGHEIAFVKKHYLTIGAKRCAQKFGCEIKKIHKLTKKLGIKHTLASRGRLTSLGHFEAKTHYDIPTAQFLDVKMPEVAYFLGYMWADGYVRKTKSGVYALILAILKKDYLMIKHSLKKLGKWRVYEFTNRTGNVNSNIQTANIPLVKWLLEKDYGQKSFVPPTKILNHIPKELHHYFWRGYMDGDGHFRIRGGVYHFSFSARYDYDWSRHVRCLNSLRIKHHISKTIQDAGRASNVVCSNMKGTYTFGSYLYKNREIDKIGLDRKYNKWLECKKRFEEIEKTNAIVIKQDGKQPLTKDLLLDIIREHSGVIGQKTIALHFRLKGWQVSELTKFLMAKKKITYIGNTSSVRYVALV